MVQLFPSTFDGVRRYFDLDMSLMPVAGHFARFAEFRPQHFLGLVFRFDLLKQFFNFDICMHVMGSYPAYVAGLLPSFDWVMVFVASKDHPILNFLFQRRSELVQTFGIGPFSLFCGPRTALISFDITSRGVISKWISSL